LDEISLFFHFFCESIDLFLLNRHLELFFDERGVLFEEFIEQHGDGKIAEPWRVFAST
jgi:hypothetical protein